MAKLTENEVALLAMYLSTQKIKEKNLREECHDTMEKYLKIRDILNELSNTEHPAVYR